MTDATLEAVARAKRIAKNVKSHLSNTVYMGGHNQMLVEANEAMQTLIAAIDAMPGWQPVTLTDIAVSGVRQAVHLQHEHLFVDYNKEGTFRLEFTQEQMRDLYNNIGAALHQPLPEPPEGADG